MKRILLMVCAVALLTACEKTITADDASNVVVDEQGNVVPTKKFTFTLKGDFSDEWKPVTRGYLAADDKDMTDVWVLDYMDGQLVQQIHQVDNTADDFGKPMMKLAYGSHHLYFIASRGLDPILDTDAKTITFSSVRDTFWKNYEVNVVATSNGNRAVTLDRVVTKLKLIFRDAIPADASNFNVTPAKWNYALNYQTGEPSGTRSNQLITVNIPASCIGIANESVNIFGFSTADEWNTDISVNAKKSNGDIIGSATLTSVPFKANRVSEFTGPLFGSDGELTMSLNTTWDTSYTSTW
jgi:hypothetical protein